MNDKFTALHAERGRYIIQADSLQLSRTIEY